MSEMNQQRFLRNFAHLRESVIANRCITCGHVKHNELGYCQIGDCGCEFGYTVGSVGVILERDWSDLLAEIREGIAAEALEKTLAPIEALLREMTTEHRGCLRINCGDCMRHDFGVRLSAALSTAKEATKHE